MRLQGILLALSLALVLGVAGCGSGGSTDLGEEDSGSTDDVGDCTFDDECDDGNDCTDDACDEGACQHTNNDEPCDDGQSCTENDECSGGECVGQALDCDDENDCTDDSCDEEEGCVHEDNTEPCDDGNACTIDDACYSGLCQGGDPLVCDDENDCTDDDCAPDSGCVFTNNTEPCDDELYCTTGDVCSGGACVGTGTQDCDDDDPCTDDSCDEVYGCTHSANTEPCDDGNPCTVGDVCAAGDCTPGGGTLDCDDSDDCTDDSCHAVLGCQHAFNTAPCDDGNACTEDDACYAGDCLGNPLDADDDTYVAAECDGGTDCDDDDEFVNPGIFEGPEGDAICGDAIDNDCDSLTDTDDTGCLACVAPADCDDGNVCNGAEDCVANDCVPGTLLNCSDGNVCTTDLCNTVTGCYWNNNTATCNDGNVCTLGDRCAGGTCSTYTSELDCTDGNLCTDDDCHPTDGCFWTNNTLPCDDSDDCTVGDECYDGACLGTLRDNDSDGYGDGTGGCAGNDCDDTNADVHPGAEEICDGIDNDCNWLEDEGCITCDTVDPTAELRIDNDAPFSGYGLDTGDEVFNVFVVDAEGYNVLEVQAAFYDFCDADATCTGGTGNGDYRLFIYEYGDDGLPGAVLASSGTVTVADQWPDLYTFTLADPLTLVQGQIVWVGIRSMEDQTSNLFLPLFDGGVTVPYQGGALYSTADDEYYATLGNFIIRVEGCAEGPWLSLASHGETPWPVAPDATATVTVTLANRDYGDAVDVVGTLTSDEEDVTVTTATADYGTIAAGGSAAGAPSFAIATSPTAFGIYPVYVESTDGPNTWYDGWGVYVQGDGCTDENHDLIVDNDTPTYYMAPEPGDEMGNYYVVDSTAFTMTSVDVEFYRNSGPPNAQFRLKVYTYRGGFPDKVIYQSSWATVSGTGLITTTFTLPTPLTFKQGDTFWAVVESQDDLAGDEFGPLLDDGDYDTGSWFNGVVWIDTDAAWYPFYSSFLIRVHGCQATELVYDSHSSSPDPIPAGSTATLNITIRNEGAQDATGVTGVLSSTHADVTVTQPSGTFGTVAADGGTATATGFQVQIVASPAEYQYMLDLELTDGVNTWNDQLPLQLQGGVVNLVAQNFTSMLVGSDIRYSWEVTNTGNIDAVVDFEIDLYYDEDSAPTVGGAGDWTAVRSYLAAGDTLYYQTEQTDAPVGNYTSYVQVDTSDAISESDETDNVIGPATLTIGTTDIFELLDPPRKWFPADMPVEYRFVDSNSQTGMAGTSENTAVINGFQHWEDVATASITFTQIANAGAGGGGFTNDGYNTMSFDDPDGDLGTGTLGACLPIYGGSTMITNGTTFRRMTDSDIVFNNNVMYATHADAGLPSCTNDFDMEGVATHEIGHLVGLDHPDVYEATMYWAVGPCDDSKTSLEESDINGVTFIYPL